MGPTVQPVANSFADVAGLRGLMSQTIYLVKVCRSWIVKFVLSLPHGRHGCRVLEIKKRKKKKIPNATRTNDAIGRVISVVLVI